jgi:hypothetical protein
MREQLDGSGHEGRIPASPTAPLKKILRTEKIKSTGTPIASGLMKQEGFVMWGLPALQFSQTSLIIVIRVRNWLSGNSP